jgi:hypothetical protein
MAQSINERANNKSIPNEPQTSLQPWIFFHPRNSYYYPFLGAFKHTRSKLYLILFIGSIITYNHITAGKIYSYLTLILPTHVNSGCII